MGKNAYKDFLRKLVKALQSEVFCYLTLALKKKILAETFLCIRFF